MALRKLIEHSWEAYWNIGVKPGRRGQTLFKLEEMHKRLGALLNASIALNTTRLTSHLHVFRTSYTFGAERSTRI